MPRIKPVKKNIFNPGTNKFHILLIILGIFILVSISILISVNRTNNINPALLKQTNNSSIMVSEEKAKWTFAIKKYGASKAYDAFKQEFSKKDFNVQHLAAHLFGAVLYDTMGINGITVCDSSFAFGCFHGFFTRAISVNGLSVVQKLDDACINKYGEKHASPCRHGIGHGLVEYMGYSPDKLTEELKACETKHIETGQAQFFGCFSGVFMEYYQPIIINGQNAQISERPLDPKKPYDMCPSLEKTFQPACYFQLGEWWQQVYNYDYKKIGALCEDITDTTNQTACFEGMGNVIGPSANYSYKNAVQRCEKLGYHNGIVLCLGAAARTISSQPGLADTAIHTCDGLELQDNALCKKYIQP